MMKKRSYGMGALLAGLLALCLLFASCQPAEDPSHTPADSGAADQPGKQETEEVSVPEEEEPIPSNEVVIYLDLAEEWKSYLNYSAPLSEQDDAWDVSELVRVPADRDEEDRTVTHRLNTDALPFVCLTTTTVEHQSGITQVTYDYYHVQTGAHFGPWSESNEAWLPDIDLQTYGGMLLAVKTTSYEWVPAEGATNPSVEGSMEAFVSCTVYASDGSVVLNQVSEEPTVRESALSDQGLVRVSVNDRVYLGSDGVILATLGEGDELPIPALRADLTAYGDRFYGWESGVGTSAYVVYDSMGRLLARYIPEQVHDRSAVTVLGDGNVLFAYETECEEEESLYTFRDQRSGQRVLYKTVLLRVSDGKAVELNPGFYITRMISSADGGESHLALTGEYQYAEIRKIADGTRSVTTTFAILDGELKVVAELPVILKDQTQLEQALDESTWLFRCEQNGRDVCYSLDLSTGKVSMYKSHEDAELSGGFLLDGALYNDKLALLYDLSDKDWYLTGDGSLILREPEGETLLAIRDGALRTVFLAGSGQTVAVDTDRHWILVEGESRTDCYSTSGEKLISGEELRIERIYEDAVLVSVADGTGRTYSVLHKQVGNESEK